MQEIIITNNAVNTETLNSERIQFSFQNYKSLHTVTYLSKLNKNLRLIHKSQGQNWKTKHDGGVEEERIK